MEFTNLSLEIVILKNSFRTQANSFASLQLLIANIRLNVCYKIMFN